MTQTLGQRLVSFNYNYSDDPEVKEIKQLYADIIDKLEEARSLETSNPDRQRYISVAITETQTAAMWAVKAITAK